MLCDQLVLKGLNYRPVMLGMVFYLRGIGESVIMYVHLVAQNTAHLPVYLQAAALTLIHNLLTFRCNSNEFWTCFGCIPLTWCHSNNNRFIDRAPGFLMNLHVLRLHRKTRLKIYSDYRVGVLPSGPFTQLPRTDECLSRAAFESMQVLRWCEIGDNHKLNGHNCQFFVSQVHWAVNTTLSGFWDDGG